jgi:hypothetical protein
MPRLNARTPKYRKHKASGQAVVTISGRDHYLGPWKSQTSISEYDRLVAEWLAAGRPVRMPLEAFGSMSINELILAHWRHLKSTTARIQKARTTASQHCAYYVGSTAIRPRRTSVCCRSKRCCPSS